MRGRRRARPPEVAEGVFRLGTRWVNFHLVTDGRDAILVDAGYPRYARQLEGALAALGLRMSEIAAVIVTHHHVDHAGTAETARAGGATVYAGQADVPIIRGERPSHPPDGFYREVWRPSMIAYLAHTVRSGGARYGPCREALVLVEDQTLDLPRTRACWRRLATPRVTALSYFPTAA